MSTPRVAATRQRNAKGHGDQLRIDLLDAAAELMAERGSVDGISLRAVARRTGVSATAVYRHFEDHTELLQASVLHCWAGFLAALQAAAHAGTDPFDSLERCGVAYADFALDRPGQYRVMFSNCIEIEHETSVVANATFQLLVDLVHAVLGELGDDRSTLTVAVQVHTWIHGIVDLSSSHPDIAWPPVAEQLGGLQRALGLERE